MVTVADIQHLISEYLHGEDVESFAAKFADLFYDIENTGVAGAVQLSYTVESLLASLSAGLLSENDFKTALHCKTPSNQVASVSFGTATAVPTQWAVAIPAVAVCGYIKPLAVSGSAIDLQGKYRTNTALVQSQLMPVA